MTKPAKKPQLPREYDDTPDVKSLDRMRDLTRKVVSVPKAEIPKAVKKDG